MSEPYYQDERVTLYGGDALAVLADLPSGSVDALITDPPYSSGGAFRGDRTNRTPGEKYLQGATNVALDEFSGDNRDQRGYLMWASLWLSEARRVVRPGGVVLLFTDWRQLPTTTDAMQSGGFVWRGIIPWRKTQIRNFSGRISTECEYVAWGSNGALPSYLDGGPSYPGFYQANAPREREHTTQKPLEVMRGLARSTSDDAVILDPFMGSGTTGVAAMLERRKFIGVEMVEHYQQVAERRIREAQGKAVQKGDQGALDFGEVTA